MQPLFFWQENYVNLIFSSNYNYKERETYVNKRAQAGIARSSLEMGSGTAPWDFRRHGYCAVSDGNKCGRLLPSYEYHTVPTRRYLQTRRHVNLFGRIETELKRDHILVTRGSYRPRGTPSGSPRALHGGFSLRIGYC